MENIGIFFKTNRSTKKIKFFWTIRIFIVINNLLYLLLAILLVTGRSLQNSDSGKSKLEMENIFQNESLDEEDEILLNDKNIYCY